MTAAEVRARRRAELSASLTATYGVEAFLTGHGVHIRHLTGFTGSNGGLLVRPDGGATVASDGRYTTQLAEQVPDLPAVIARECLPALLATLPAGPVRIGFEAGHVTVAQREALEAAASELDAAVELVPLIGVVESGRQVKTAGEIEALAAVAELATAAFEAVIATGGLRPGVTERQVAADLEYRFRLLGADGPSFATIVASGPNSAKPHHGAGDRVIHRGDLVTVDFGATAGGWNSDMTRTLAVGEPGERAREVHDTVRRAQAAGVAAVRAGSAGRAVDAACRDLIAAAGFGEHFVHSTGHGVGLEVHEAPALSLRSTDTLSAGMVVTVEPGIYLPGEFGVRIEDTVVVADGEAEPRLLTQWPTDLTVVGP